MKKLSLLVALALIVTVGGVYAAWNYAQGATASVEITREINMAQVNTNSNKGSIAATPKDVTFLVDDAGGYHTELTGSGYFDIVFTASPGADKTTADNGIKMIATVTVKSATNAKYGEVTPLTVKTGQNTIALTGDTTSKTAKLEVSDVLECVTLCNVVLDTKDKNDAFHNVLKDYTIVITISEVVA